MEAENPLLWQRISVASNAKLFQSSAPRKEMSLERFIHVQRMYHVSTGRLTQQDDRVDLAVDEIPIILPDAEWDDEDAAKDGEEEELFPISLASSPPHQEKEYQDDIQGDVYNNEEDDDDDDDEDEDEEDDRAERIVAEEQPSATSADDAFRAWGMPSYEGTEEGIISVFNLDLLSHIPLPPSVLEDFQDALVSDDFQSGILPPSTPNQVTPLLYEVVPSLATVPLSAATPLPSTAPLLLESSSTTPTNKHTDIPADAAMESSPPAAALQPEKEEEVFPLSRKRLHRDDNGDENDDDNDGADTEASKRRRSSLEINTTTPSTLTRKREQREDGNTNDEPVITKRLRGSLDSTTEGNLTHLQRSLPASPRIPPMNCGQEDEEHDSRDTEHQPTSIPGDATPPPIILGV